MATLKVSLTERMRHWIDAQAKQGEYASASDYIRDLVRHDQSQCEALRIELIAAEQSGMSSRRVKDIIANAGFQRGQAKVA